ncbi:unnamed protein product [Camellia sinensis]
MLIFLATSRKRTGRRIVILMIWAAYLLADWIAAFAVGLISNGQGNGCDVHPLNDDLPAFWAPFLLLHLGGPDTITAFALEDNELWIRHLLGLLIQLTAIAYVFSQSIPNKLWIPTVLMIFAGLIKYAERTRALYMACLGNFKASMLPKPDPGPNYAQLMEEYSSNKEAQVPVRIEITKEPEKGSRTTDEEKNSQPQVINEIEVVQEGMLLKGKALEAEDSKIAKEICSARGNWVLSQHLCPHQEILASVSEEVEYDESLLLWHVATELCYFTGETDPNCDEETKNKREICMILSEYMLYLLVIRPTMMSAVLGIGQIRFQDTCVEAKKFFQKGQSGTSLALKEMFNKFFDRSQSELDPRWREVCNALLGVDTVVKPINVKGDRSKSLLFDACMLAKDLNELKFENRWKIMSEVWVELLSYAASHIRPNSHAEQLSKAKLIMNK